MSLKKLFTPNIFIDKIEDLNPKQLLNDGYKAIILDIDNTLMPNNSPKPDERCMSTIKMFKEVGLTVVISSNNKYKRVSKFCDGLDVKWYCWSFKPLPFVYKRIMKDFNFKNTELITCGDQLLTDIWGSNNMKITSILVKPLKLDEDRWNTKLNRIVERFLFKHVVNK